MLALFDTVNAIRVHFTDTARYESLIRLLDICNKEEVLTYAPYKDDVWIFKGIINEDERQRILSPICGILFEEERVPSRRSDTLLSHFIMTTMQDFGPYS